MRPALSRNVAASVLNAAAVVSISLVTVPLILDAVGTAGYGVWTLGLALILYASILETGLGPSIQRFTAFARGAGDDDTLGRLGWTTLALYLGGGLLGGGLLALLAPVLVDLFDLPRRLHDDAETMFRLLGGALALALLAAGMGNLLQGLERFGTLAVSAAAGALAFLAGVIVLAGPEGLPGLAIAMCIGQGVTLSSARARCAASPSPAAPPSSPAARSGADRLLRPPAAQRPLRARQLAERQARRRARGARRDRRAARHRRAVRRRWAAALRRRPLPRSSRRSRSPPGPATRRGCAAASPSSTGCGCSACSGRA